jgi:hypothetical protein
MHTYSPSIVLLLIVATFALIRWSSARSGRAVLQRKFKAGFDPGGPYTVCEVRFVLDDVAATCAVRTTGEGWYMETPAPARARRNWSHYVPVLDHGVFIPWPSLDYQRARFPLRSWTRFDVKGTRASFFVRSEVALTLLRAAGMPPPTDS